MVTNEQVMSALSEVIDPELGRDLVSLNMIRDLHIDGDSISFTLVLTIEVLSIKKSYG